MIVVVMVVMVVMVVIAAMAITFIVVVILIVVVVLRFAVVVIAGYALIVILIIVAWRYDLGQSAFADERDAVRAVGHRDHAILSDRGFILFEQGAIGQLNHILRTQRADDHVLAAARMEYDPVGRAQGRDIDRVVTRRTGQGDRIRTQAGSRT